jgi:hypothetical protein
MQPTTTRSSNQGIVSTPRTRPKKTSIPRRSRASQAALYSLKQKNIKASSGFESLVSLKAPALEI